jgi:hypothetical protein
MRPAAMVLILCAGWLAACSGTTQPFSKAGDAPLDRTPPQIFVATITGLPAGEATAVLEALISAAAQRGIAVGSGKVRGEFALAGEFEGVATNAAMAVHYRWTLTDGTGRVLHRIEETEAVGPLAGEAASGLGGAPVERIAAYTAESLSSRFSQLGYATRAAGMPPPLDHLVQAGPGAEQEIDYETLHGPGMAGLSDPSADFDPLEPRTDARPPSGDGPAARAASTGQAIQGVAITGVEGAGRTGNEELARALARVLTDAGWPVIQRPRDDVLAIQGEVTLSQPSGNAQKVALRWTVRAPDGEVLGAVEQANEVPAGSLDSGWGAAADHAALAAAQGIFDLVDKLR